MIEKKEVQYAKEIDDVLVLVNVLVADIKEKKPITEIATDCLPKLMTAIDGIAGVKEELAANKEVALETVGYRVGELTNTLIS